MAARPALVHPPLHFEANLGQADPRVKFVAQGQGYRLFLTATEAVLTFRPGQDGGRDQSSVRLGLVGARQDVGVEGLDLLPGKVNYFIGNDPTRWRADVPTFARVRYRNVYPGVDLVYHGGRGSLEFDLVLAPGADPEGIRLSLTGADRVRLEPQGDLVAMAGGREIRLGKPLVYQETARGHREIESGYVLAGDGAVGFSVAAYDRRLALIIDPIVYATYLGGTNDDSPSNIRVDSGGNILLAGATQSLNFPTQNPLQATNISVGTNGSCFVSKLNPAGSALLYSTYLGGSADSACSGMTADRTGNVYVVGPTNSTNFPVTGNAFQAANAGGFDVFVAKINPAGNALLYSTYLGGSAFDNGRGIAADDAGHVWVSGMTNSTNFPVKNAMQPAIGGLVDLFVAKLDTTQSGANSLLFATYFGGAADDAGGFVGATGIVSVGLAIDPAGNVYGTGITSSTNLPVLNAFQPTFGGGPNDGFVLKLDPSGAKVYATYLGGTGGDVGFAIGADAGGNAYVCGVTNPGSNFPLKNPIQGSFGGGQADSFLVKLDAAGQELFGTFFGGNGDESCQRMVVDAVGNSYFTGNTSSTVFPLVNAVQNSFGGGTSDTWIAQVNPAGTAIAFSSFLGGTGAEAGSGIGLDAGGNIYVAMPTNSPNLPLVAPVQAVNRGGNDVYIARISVPGGSVASILPISRAVQTGGPATVFGTIINTGTDVATGCTISTATAAPVSSLFQTTDPSTNALTGSPNTPADIQPGASQTFLIALTPNAPFGATDVPLDFGCTNRPSVFPVTGLNTLLMSASDTAQPDIVALGATPSGDGIVNIPGAAGTGVFSVATVNVGASGQITASADTGGVALPVTLSICQTNPVNAQCVTPLGPTATVQINAGQTPTFAVFAQGNGIVPFNPALNRVFVRFNDAGSVTRGATSAALRTQ
jgi:hypothetical protein